MLVLEKFRQKLLMDRRVTWLTTGITVVSAIGLVAGMAGMAQIPSAAASSLVTDGFDTGTSSFWTTTTRTGSNSSVQVTAAAAQSGSYGLDTAKLGTNDNGHAEVSRAISAPASNTLSVQTAMRVVSRDGSGGMYLQRIYRTAPIYQPLAAIHAVGGVYSLRVRELNGSMVELPLQTQFANGTWYQVELVYDWHAAQPVASVYVNGVLDASITDSTGGTVYAPDSAYLGLYEDSWTQRAEVQWDSTSIGDAVQTTAAASSPSSAATAPASNPASVTGGSNLFQSGFETGSFSDWDGTVVTGSGAVAQPTAQAAQTGSFGADFTNGAANHNGVAEAWKTLNAAPAAVTLQSAVRANSVSGNGVLVVLELYHNSPIYNGIARFEYIDGTWQFSLRARNGQYLSSAAVPFSSGNWHQVQMTYDTSGAQPVLRGSIDGASPVTITDSSAGTVYAPDRVNVGLHELSWSASADVSIDNVAVAGSSTSPVTNPSPTATTIPAPTSTPTTVPTVSPTATSVPVNPPSSQQPVVNVPYFASSVDQSQAAVVWLGQVNSNTDYADVRLGYTPTQFVINATVIDRQLWYQPNLTTLSPNLTSYDSTSLFLNTGQGSTAYRLDAELSWYEARAGYQAAYAASGGTWLPSGLAFTTTTGWRGQGPNSGVDARGWVVSYTIPFSSLGMSGPPAQGTTWNMAMQVHNRDDAAGTAISDQVWPGAMNTASTSTWGQLRFGLPSYTAPALPKTGSVSIAQGLNGASVPDGAAGGYTNCGTAAGSVGFFPTWGSLNYNGYPDFNVQNESDVSDFPCFSKYYVTFPLSSLPAGKTILNAQFVLHQFGGSGNGDTSLMQVSTVNQGFNPATLNWNNAPAPQENVSQALVPGVASTPPWPGIARQWDLSYAVAQAYAAGKTSLTLVVYSPDTNYNSGKYFVSSETGDWNAAGRPTLQISWGG